MKAVALLVASLAVAPWVALEAAAPGPLTEAQVAGALNALDRADMDVADFMAGATQDGDIKRFALQVQDDHAALDRNVATVATRLSLAAADSPAASAARREALGEIADLKTRSGPALDKAYLAAAVKSQAATLDQLDGALASSARRPEVKALVADARAIVVRHLAEAQALQRKLGAAPAAAPALH